MDAVELQLECLRDATALESLAAEWDALEANVTPRAPFRTAHWNILWWKHFRESRATVHDELRAYALRDGQGRLVAVAPMMLTRRPGRFLPFIREIQFFGADPNMTEMRGLVCRTEDQPAVLEALKRELLARRSEWDWIQWTGIESRVPGREVLEQGGGVRWRPPTRDYYLQLPQTWEAFRGGLSRNIKESLRKCYNSLKRDGHAFSFRVVSSPQEAASAIECFLDLHAGRSKVQGTVAHPNVFAREATRAFLFEYAEQAARQDRLRVFQLVIADCVVATRIGFLLGDELFLYYSGYRPEWGRYSVMTTVVSEALQWAIANGIRVVNLSTGSDVSKTRWDPVEVCYHNGLQSSPAPLSRLGFNVYQVFYEGSRGEGSIARLMQVVRRKH